MTKIIDAKIIKDKIIVSENICYYIIKITNEVLDIKSIRILFIGPTNSGKSTIIGNLKKINDDSKGKVENMYLIINMKYIQEKHQALV